MYSLFILDLVNYMLTGVAKTEIHSSTNKVFFFFFFGAYLKL